MCRGRSLGRRRPPGRKEKSEECRYSNPRNSGLIRAVVTGSHQNVTPKNLETPHRGSGVQCRSLPVWCSIPHASPVRRRDSMPRVRRTLSGAVCTKNGVDVRNTPDCTGILGYCRGKRSTKELQYYDQRIHWPFHL